MRAGAIVTWLALLLGISATQAARDDSAPIVAAATNLRLVLPVLAEQFRRQTGESIRLSFGSSGNLNRQITQGAPFELFLSADEYYVLSLAEQGHGRDTGVVYAVGQLVLLVPKGSPLGADGSLTDVAAVLSDTRLRRLAIANPEHAPYGKRAREVLQRLGRWEQLEEHLVLGENVSQAAQFTLSGNAQAGIVAHSLVISPRIASQASYQRIPTAWHLPLRQRMLLLANAGDTARRFYHFLQSSPARSTLHRFGFLPPGDED
jgi:molybdate transport system substrate-binding protein